MHHTIYLKKRRILFFITVITLFLFSCKKYLDQKALQTLAIPTTLADMQALLDNNILINQNSPELLELVADNYYMTTTNWQSIPGALAEDERLNYLWDKNASFTNAWQLPYQYPVYYANVVLDQLPQVKDKNASSLYNTIKGAALFYRAFAFYQLAQLYCKPFSASAKSDAGIVLRLTGSISEPSIRATVQQTYDQIINDLKASVDLLPESTAFPSRPNKPAAYGALARVYLSMRDYINAGLYADKCLQKHNELMDYNTVANTNGPFGHFNSETIYYNLCTANGSALYGNTGRIDTLLYSSYDSNDLRKSLFFKENRFGDAGSFRFKGSYDADYYSQGVFDGIATDEMYLIRAESFARTGDVNSAMTDLNTLMINRWKNNGSFIPFSANDASEALQIILTERRKELLYRGLRWSDIRRLNLDGANIILTRIIDGVTYTLPPNDLRSVLLIPPVIITRSGIAQNPR